MQDRKHAFKVLSLQEYAGRQEIEDRYYVLAKKYKYLANDEQPSLNEPTFADINEAYHLLIGYAPLQQVQFKELNWKDRLQHIRENFMMEIILSVVLVLFISIVGVGAHDLYKAIQTKIVNPGVSESVKTYSPFLELNIQK